MGPLLYGMLLAQAAWTYKYKHPFSVSLSPTLSCKHYIEALTRRQVGT